MMQWRKWTRATVCAQVLLVPNWIRSCFWMISKNKKDCLTWCVLRSGIGDTPGLNGTTSELIAFHHSSLFPLTLSLSLSPPALHHLSSFASSLLLSVKCSFTHSHHCHCFLPLTRYRATQCVRVFLCVCVYVCVRTQAHSHTALINGMCSGELRGTLHPCLQHN